MNDGTPIRPAMTVELGASGEEFQNLHEFVRKARANLNQNAWDYIVGAAETETTMRRNRMALDEIAFRIQEPLLGWTSGLNPESIQYSLDLPRI